MSTIIDGKTVSTGVKDDVKSRVSAFFTKTGKNVGLAVIMVGDNTASQIYVRNKIRACEYVGIKSFCYTFDEGVSENEIIDLIEALNADANVHGILVQLPLPKGVDEEKVLSHISVSKDVDGFSSFSIGNLALGKAGFKSCTPYGVMRLIKEYGIDVAGKNAVVIGRSNIVGKPMAMMLLNANATVTVCHSKTKNLCEITKNADIVVVAIGKPRFLTANMVKKGAVVIDVGINKIDCKTVGDVDFEEVSKIASYITPVPGGVGPMTIAMLMENTVLSAENTLKNE